MSWSEPDRFEDPDGEEAEADSGRWPLDWRGLYPRERWIWFERLWTDVCMLRERYRIAVRSGWWEDAIQVEALAALAAWSNGMTRANGTIPRASSRSCSTSSASRRCCATATSRSIRNVTGSRSPAF
jgi:hypothetical protein